MHAFRRLVILAEHAWRYVTYGTTIKGLSYYDLKVDTSFSSRSDKILCALGRGFIFILWITRRRIQFLELISFLLQSQNFRLVQPQEGRERWCQRLMPNMIFSFFSFLFPIPSILIFVTNCTERLFLALQWLRSRETAGAKELWKSGKALKWPEAGILAYESCRSSFQLALSIIPLST